MKKTFGPEDDEIFHDAAQWIVRASEDDFSDEDAVSLDSWRNADTRNEAAYQQLKSLWEEIPTVTTLADKAPLASNDDEDAPAPPKGSWGRKAAGWLTGLAAAAAVFGLVLFSRPVSEPAEHFSTEVAQISKVGLSDGSVATLGPKSEIDVEFSSDKRRLQLAKGEAFFEVTKAPERPFFVEAGHATVRVVGTKFNVKRDGETVRVAVLEGKVQLQVEGRDGVSRGLLQKGEQAEMSVGPNGRARLRMLGKEADLAKFGALTAGWREGWLAYDNAKLGDIVADLNRYYPSGIRLADASLAQLRVTASFKAERIPQFVTSLEPAFAVTAVQQPDGSYVLKPAG